jgi:hypothetical protein
MDGRKREIYVCEGILGFGLGVWKNFVSAKEVHMRPQQLFRVESEIIIIGGGSKVSR